MVKLVSEDAEVNLESDAATGSRACTSRGLVCPRRECVDHVHRRPCPTADASWGKPQTGVGAVPRKGGQRRPMGVVEPPWSRAAPAGGLPKRHRISEARRGWCMARAAARQQAGKSVVENGGEPEPPRYRARGSRRAGSTERRKPDFLRSQGGQVHRSSTR